jgi:FMNH2-dependent dimethyl sulfone monooxygenase
MFNIELADSHDVRYDYGQEWYDLVQKIWSNDEEFDWRGEYFDLKHVYGKPKPFRGILPPIMNAGSSDQGKSFAARNADYLFTVLVDLESGRQNVIGIEELARQYNRDIGVFTTTYVVCRPSQKEAEEYHDYYANEQADWPAVDRLMELQGLHAKSFPPEAFKLFRNRFAAGHGVYPLVGDPDHITDELVRIHEAGFAGTTITFVNYLDEFPYFRDEVLPRLEQKGLREKLR